MFTAPPCPPVVECLGCKPLDRKGGVRFLGVGRAAVECLGQTKVTDLRHVSLAEENVPGREVPMEHLQEPGARSRGSVPSLMPDTPFLWPPGRPRRAGAWW